MGPATCHVVEKPGPPIEQHRPIVLRRDSRRRRRTHRAHGILQRVTLNEIDHRRFVRGIRESEQHAADVGWSE